MNIDESKRLNYLFERSLSGELSMSEDKELKNLYNEFMCEDRPAMQERRAQGQRNDLSRLN